VRRSASAFLACAQGPPAGRRNLATGMNSANSLPVWPKTPEPLTDEESQILDEWRKYWHLELCTKIGVFDRYTESFVGTLATRTPKGARTLEIGPGLTGVARLLDDVRTDAIEVDPYFAAELAQALPHCNVIVGDIQTGLPALESNAYDRIVAFHVLEHLPDLPAALAQIKRAMRPDAVFDVMLPCEGGAMYSLGRRVTTARYFKKKFNRDFRKFIAQEHVSTCAEILELLGREFTPDLTVYYPTRVPSVDVNLAVGLRLRRRSAGT
jgi:SAM-dependent methyltransferase